MEKWKNNNDSFELSCKGKLISVFLLFSIF